VHYDSCAIEVLKLNQLEAYCCCGYDAGKRGKVDTQRASVYAVSFAPMCVYMKNQKRLSIGCDPATNHCKEECKD